MSFLNVRKETVLRVDAYTLDNFIKDVTGHSYECVAYEEWGRDSEHWFDIDGELDEFEQPNWDNFKKTGKIRTFCLRDILNGLVKDGHIQPGIYLVTVC